MPLSIVIHHYWLSMDLNRQSGVVNCTNLGGISCLPGIIIHYNLFKIFLMGGLDKEQTLGKGAPMRAASPNKKVESHRQNWMNMVDPWSIQWIKTMANKTTDNRTLKHLKMFVHQIQIAKVTPDLVQKIRQLSSEEVHFSIRELQNKPKFVQRKCSTNSLETKGTIIMTNSTKWPIVVLVDSRCSKSSIDESFV